MEELCVEAKLENLPSVIGFVTGTLTEACPPRARMHVELAVEEIFVNIVSYAYADGEGSVTVRRSGGEGDEGLTLVFIDGGVPYNPIETAEPDFSLKAEERKIGGLGVFLVKQIADEVKYEYKDGKNTLYIKKYIKK